MCKVHTVSDYSKSHRQETLSATKIGNRVDASYVSKKLTEDVIVLNSKLCE